MSPRLRQLLVPLLLVAAVFAVGHRSLGHDFLNYDDPEVVQNNPRLEDPGLDDAVAVFTEVRDQAWLPLYYLALMPDSGGGPERWHLGSLLWHALAAILVWRFLARLTAKEEVAVLGALIFAVHPVAVESVAWISGRKDQVSLVLVFLGLIAWMRWLEEGRRSALVVAAIALLLAPFGKGTAVVHPGLAALVWIALKAAGRIPAERRPLLPWLAFTAMGIGAAVVHLSVAAAEGTAGAAVAHGTGTAALLGLEALWRYVLHLVAPIQLSITYAMDSWSGFGIAHAFGLVVLLGGLFAALHFLRRGQGWVAFAIAWLLVTLVPFNNVFPKTAIPLADRYLALGLPAFGLLVAVLLQRLPASPRRVVGVIIVVLLGVLHHDRTADFENGEAVGRAALQTEPEAPLGPTLVAEALLARAPEAADPRSVQDEALGLLRDALVLTERQGDPVRTLQARIRLGDTLLQAGRFEEAEVELRACRESALAAGERFSALGGDAALVRHNWAQALVGLGRLIDARRELDAVLAEQPRHPHARFTNTRIALRQGLKSRYELPEQFHDEAEAQVNEAFDALERLVSELETSRAGQGPFPVSVSDELLTAARRELGGGLLQAPWRVGRILAVSRMAEKLVEEAPDEPHGYLLRSDLKAALGQPESEVYLDLTRALDRAPDDPGLLMRVSRAALTAGQNKVAAKLVRKAMSIVPDDPAPRRELAQILLASARAHQNAGRDGRALDAVVEALALTPDDVEALVAAAQIHEGARRFKDAGAAWVAARAIDPEREDARKGEARWLQWVGMGLLANLPTRVKAAPASEREALERTIRDEIEATFRRAVRLGGDGDDVQIARRHLRDKARPQRKEAAARLREQGFKALGQNELKLAIDLLSKARDTDGGDVKTRWLLSEAHLRDGNTDLALKEIEVAIALDPKDLRVLGSAARLRFIKNDVAGARRAAESFLELARGHPAGELLAPEVKAIEELLARIDASGG